jgi:hypothetical protein
MSDPLPVLRCESRRPPSFERSFLLWSLALVLVGAAALDAFWAAPQRARRGAHPAIQARISRCQDPPRRTVEREVERKVEDIKLLTPTQAAR